MQPTSNRPGSGRLTGIAFIALTLLLTASLAGADEPEPIFAAARDAVANGRITGTALIGFDNGRGSVRDAPPDGGILVGFEVGLGEWVGKPTVYSLRPLYLTATGVAPSQAFGLAEGQSGRGKNAPRSKVTRTVTVQARPGFAVSAVFLDTGLNIDAIAVTFMRMRDTRLDPNQAYTGDWVGSRSDKKPRILNSDGDPIVGIKAREDDVHVMALGLIRMQQVEPAPPKPNPAAAREPAPRVNDRAEPNQKAGPPADVQPATPAPTSSGDGDFPWLLCAVFGIASVAFFAGAMLFLRLRDAAREQADEADIERRGQRRRRRRSSSPDRDDLPRRRSRGDLAEDEIPEVLPVDDAESAPPAPPT